MSAIRQTYQLLPRQRGNVDTPEDSGDHERTDDGLSGGAIAGIVIGVLAAIAIVIAATWWFSKKHRQNQARDLESQKTAALDARSSVGTRPSNVGGHADAAHHDRNVPVHDQETVQGPNGVVDGAAAPAPTAPAPGADGINGVERR